MKLDQINPEDFARLQMEWLRNPFTQDLLDKIDTDVSEIKEHLLAFAQNHVQDTVRITNTLNRWLTLERLKTYARDHRERE